VHAIWEGEITENNPTVKSKVKGGDGVYSPTELRLATN
jgi:hypothetical protein